MEAKNIVELREALMEQLQLCMDGKMSSEALKGINGSVNQIIKTLSEELIWAKYLNKKVNDASAKFMFVDGQ